MGLNQKTILQTLFFRFLRYRDYMEKNIFLRVYLHGTAFNGVFLTVATYNAENIRIWSMTRTFHAKK